MGASSNKLDVKPPSKRGDGVVQIGRGPSSPVRYPLDSRSLKVGCLASLG